MAPLFTRRSGRATRSMISSPVNVSAKHNHLAAITASGEKINRRMAESIKRVAQPWQSRAFSYYDSLGEIKYASQFYSRMLAPLELFAAEMDPDTGEITRTEDPDAIAALERIQDPGGGRTGILSQYGRLMFLTGEAMLFVSSDPETNEEQWEMLSSDELRFENGSYQRYRAPSLGSEDYSAPADEGDWTPVEGKDAVAYRLWQKHPRYSMLADSTMQGVLDLCEELLLLTQAVRSRARSRLAGSGILFIDASIAPADAEAEPEPDEDPDEDPFISELTETMTEPIADEGSAAAVVPMVVRVQVPEGKTLSEMVHHLQIVDPSQLYPETGLRYELIKRIATGLDMPPEELLGMSDANHWTAWQVSEDTWKAHGQPKAQQLVDDLSSSYYRPALRASKGDDAKRFLIGYDASAIINHPDKAKDAKDLYDRVAIGKAALREASGFDEEDAPSDEERAEMIGIKVHDATLAWFGEPGVKPGGVEVSPGEIVTSDSPDGGADATSGGSDVEKGPPESTSTPGKTPDDVAASGQVSRIFGAADLAILRSREAAGAKIRSYARRDESVHLNGHRNADLAHLIGREKLKALGVPSAAELVAGVSRDVLRECLSVWGVRDQHIAEIVADTVEKHAAQTLFDRTPKPLPSSFAEYLTGLLTAGR